MALNLRAQPHAQTRALYDELSASLLNLVGLNLYDDGDDVPRCNSEHIHVYHGSMLAGAGLYTSRDKMIDADGGGRDDHGQYGCEVDDDYAGNDVESRTLMAMATMLTMKARKAVRMMVAMAATTTATTTMTMMTIMLLMMQMHMGMTMYTAQPREFKPREFDFGLRLSVTRWWTQVCSNA